MIIIMFLQYLERNNIKEFGRENFSFNTRVKVGQFFEGQAGTAVSGTCLFVSAFIKKILHPKKTCHLLSIASINFLVLAKEMRS